MPRHTDSEHVKGLVNESEQRQGENDVEGGTRDLEEHGADQERSGGSTDMSDDDETGVGSPNGNEESDDDADGDDDDDEEEEPLEPRILPPRETRGRRFQALVGEQAEADEQFWGHDTWAEERDDEEWSTEDEGHYKDVADSDFFDTTSEEEEPTTKNGVTAEQLQLEEAERQEKAKQKQKTAYKDPRNLRTGERRKPTTTAPRPMPPPPAKPRAELATSRGALGKTKKSRHRVLSQEDHLELAALNEQHNQKRLNERIDYETWKKATRELKQASSVWTGSMTLLISWASDRLIETEEKKKKERQGPELTEAAPTPVTSRDMLFFVDFDKPMNSCLPPIYSRSSPISPKVQMCAVNPLLKARYRDPLSGEYYSDMTAFRVLRQKYGTAVRVIAFVRRFVQEEYMKFRSRLNRVNMKLKRILRFFALHNLLPSVALDTITDTEVTTEVHIEDDLEHDISLEDELLPAQVSPLKHIPKEEATQGALADHTTDDSKTKKKLKRPKRPAAAIETPQLHGGSEAKKPRPTGSPPEDHGHVPHIDEVHLGVSSTERRRGHPPRQLDRPRSDSFVTTGLTTQTPLSTPHVYPMGLPAAVPPPLPPPSPLLPSHVVAPTDSTISSVRVKRQPLRIRSTTSMYQQHPGFTAPQSSVVEGFFQDAPPPFSLMPPPNTGVFLHGRPILPGASALDPLGFLPSSVFQVPFNGLPSFVVPTPGSGLSPPCDFPPHLRSSESSHPHFNTNGAGPPHSSGTITGFPTTPQHCFPSSTPIAGRLPQQGSECGQLPTQQQLCYLYPSRTDMSVMSQSTAPATSIASSPHLNMNPSNAQMLLNPSANPSPHVSSIYCYPSPSNIFASSNSSLLPGSLGHGSPPQPQIPPSLGSDGTTTTMAATPASSSASLLNPQAASQSSTLQ